MAEKDKEKTTIPPETGDEEEIVIVMTDDDGAEHYFIQELIIPVGEEKYALLVPDDYDGEADEDGDEIEVDDDAAFFAKIVVGEDGEEEYIEPSDEEFDAVMAAYEKLMEED